MSSAKPAPVPSGPADSKAAQSGEARSSAIMAAGTLVSRFLGFAKTWMLAAALGLGSSVNDTFINANNLPNLIFLLVAGGVFNAVLVPQIIKASKAPDKGADYISRLLTLAVLVLLVLTLLVTLLAPYSHSTDHPGLLAAAEGPRGVVRVLVPSADLLLRPVRPADPGPQRPRGLRARDVGADRQQRRGDRRAGHVHRHHGRQRRQSPHDRQLGIRSRPSSWPGSPRSASSPRPPSCSFPCSGSGWGCGRASAGAGSGWAMPRS